LKGLKPDKLLAAFLVLFSVFLAAALFAESGEPSEPPRPLRQNRDASFPYPLSSTSRSPVRQPASRLLTESNLEKDLTRYYIKQYSSPGGLAWLKAIMDRGGPYLGFIRQEIKERGLPAELLYLPVIESQFLPAAVSRSGAAGLWQFMRNSIAPFDMKVNDWLDERRDFWKSTRGALQKLEENYNYFGDWLLALAAYNAGLGGVSRVVKASPGNDYWALCQKKELKTETIHYVPKLLAAAEIISNPRKYGLDPSWEKDPQWIRIPCGRQADLGMLAAEAGIDAGALQKANRELLYGITPPDGSYHLKVPLADAEKVSAVLSRADLPLVKYYIYTIGSGDTLLALALHYGVSVDQILQSNPGTQARYLKIGSRLMIPAFKEAAPYTRQKLPAQGLDFSGSHLVKKGETLWSIALAYELDPEALAEANGMRLDDLLREGRSLKTPIILKNGE
jgi:membrane-bound lytic murein transglycosylase D